MEIAHPSLAWLGLLLLIPVLLHVVRRPPRPHEVSTLAFIKALARQRRERPWLRRLKRWLALLLSLAILGGAILALMDVMLTDGAGKSPRSVVVALDRSASMGALLPDSRTRLQAAAEELKRELGRLNPAVRISVIGWDERPEVLVAAESDLRRVLRVVEGVEPRPAEGNPDAARELALALARQAQRPAGIWWVSDRPMKGGEEVEDGRLCWMGGSFPSEAGLNVGLTAFRLRPLPMQPGRLSCFLEAAGNVAAGTVVEARLEIRAGGLRLPAKTLRVKPGEPVAIDFPVEAKAGQELHLRLVAEGDSLADDNDILVLLPEANPIVAVRAGPRERIDPYAHLALQSLAGGDELQVWSVEPAQWPVRGAGVVIFDSWLPETWPEDVPVVVLNPPESCGPVRVAPLSRGGAQRSRIRVAEPEHPVLFRVSSDRIAVTQTGVVKLPAGMEPLWKAERDTILAAGEWNGQRVVVMAFSPHRSAHLPLTESYPLLMGNAIAWCAGPEGRPGKMDRLSLRTGGLVAVEGGAVTWGRETGRGRLSETLPVTAGLLKLDRAGIWETDAGEMGAAHLLSLQETEEAGSFPSSQAEAESVPGRASRAGWGPAGRLTPVILGVILALLVVESWLIHRFGA